MLTSRTRGRSTPLHCVERTPNALPTSSFAHAFRIHDAVAPAMYVSAQMHPKSPVAHSVLVPAFATQLLAQTIGSVSSGEGQRTRGVGRTGILGLSRKHIRGESAGRKEKQREKHLKCLVDLNWSKDTLRECFGLAYTVSTADARANAVRRWCLDSVEL